jgi:uncharacterized protein DUF3617
MKAQYVLVATMLCAASFCASAQSMKPGLWEINNKMQADGKRGNDMDKMQQEMAKMSAEDRKMMEGMMAKHGVGVGNAGPGSISTKICVTREMAERNEIPSQKDGCKQSVSPRSGNTMKIAFTCTNPPSSGEGQVTFVSAEAYTMNMTMTTVADGQPQKVNMDAAGKWLSADCGAVKPRGMPQK